MSEVVDSKESQNATPSKSNQQATANGLADPVLDPRVEEMASEPAPTATSASGAGEQVTTDAVEMDAEADGASEAETLIQSPEKQRTNPENASAATSNNVAKAKDGSSTGGAVAMEIDSKSRKRKRSVGDAQDETTFSSSSRHSSPLSSPRIPPHSADSDSDISTSITTRTPKVARRKREKNTADSEEPDEKRGKTPSRRRRPSDILPPISKHRTKNSTGGAEPGSSDRRETRSATYPRHSSQDRSPSPKPPPRREHRRGVSTQLTHGDVERKKRGRPPAIQTRSGSADHNRAASVSSDDLDSPRQPRPALHKFSSAEHDNMSPAKGSGPPGLPMAQTRKWRDKNGRTFLSRACNNNDLENAKLRLAERPEDLNLADNAGNTPLQIAALEGFVNIVKFLLESKCDVDTRNIDKETPLIDAVENGHVEVVKLLLQHGANPRLGNAKGDEPYELVPQDDENYDEIRRLLADARENPFNRRVSSDHNETRRDNNSSRAASAASPRDSPPIIGPRSPPAFASRRRTGRSESTRNDLLWQANTQENLAKLAANGDVQGVANILNILQKAETESLINAAKAGHEEVLQYLLGMGDPEPDPDPIRHLKPGYNTPLLAAIGKGHPEVVKLLIEQSGFNPTRKLLKGKTYFEISAERKGEQWQKEFEILKTAYDEYGGGKTRKTTSPRATRDADKLKARVLRRSQSPISSKLRNSSSPTMTHKALPRKPHSHKDKDRDSGSADGTDRRKYHASKRDIADSSVAVTSDQDQSVLALKKGHIKRRSQSDLPQPPNLDSEASHRRRRLVSGKEHRKGKSSLVEESLDEESAVAVKAEGKPSAVLKRTRDSASPEPAATEEGDKSRSTAKKRRTVPESSPEETRPGPRRKSTQLSPGALERKADGGLSVGDESKRTKSTKTDKPAQTDVSEKMDGDKTEGGQVETIEMPEPMGPHSEAPASGEQTVESIKVEPVEAGPSEAQLELQRQEEARKAEASRQAEEQREAEEARRAEEAKRLEEERIAAEKAAEERRLAEEAERRMAEERERRLAEEAERRRKAEEEAALRKKEEEERQERIKRELEERQRRQEEQLRQARLEMERRRREALPIVLNHTALMIDNNDPKVRSEAWLKKLLPLFTVRSVQLDPATGDASKNDLWIPNFQAAFLLLTKDLNLRNYTSLEKRPVTVHERQCLWKVSRNMLSYEYETNQFNTPIKLAMQREEEEKPKFYAMEELFWVKLSDFEDQIFRHPHLGTLPISKQPISLRVVGPQSPDQSPQANGISPKLTNGIGQHLSPIAYSNGIGYTR